MIKSRKFINWCSFNEQGAGVEESYGEKEVFSCSDADKVINSIPSGSEPMFFVESKEVSLEEFKKAF